MMRIISWSIYLFFCQDQHYIETSVLALLIGRCFRVICNYIKLVLAHGPYAAQLDPKCFRPVKQLHNICVKQ